MSEQIFEIVGTDPQGKDGVARITWDVASDISANESTILVKKIETRGTPALPSSYFIQGTIYTDSMQGNIIANAELGGGAACTGSLGANYTEVISSPQASKNGLTFWPRKIKHRPDGTMSVPVFLEIYCNDLFNDSYALQKRIIGSTTVELPRIPRVSSVTASPVTLGNTMTISIQRAVSTFTDTITYKCGTATGTIATKTSSSSVTWTPPTSLAAQFPNSDSARVEIIVTTYIGNTEVGSSSYFVDCPIPGTLAPTVSATVTDTSGHYAKYGKYVSSKSTVNVRATFSGVQGSTITKVEVTCGGITKSGVISGSSSTIGVTIVGSGSVPITTTVTDSRGRIARTVNMVQSASYSSPTVRIQKAYRCSATGSNQPDGAYATVIFTATATNLQPASGYSNNSPRYYVRYRERGTQAWQSVAISMASSSAFNPQSYPFVFAANTEKAYDCSIMATDDFGSVESTYLVIPVAFALVDFDRRNQSIGFGQRATGQNTMHVGMVVNMHEHLIKNLLDPVDSGDAVTKSYIDGFFGDGQPATQEYIDNAIDALRLEIYSVIAGGDVPTSPAPTITSHPSNKYVSENSNVTFSVTATGTDITYQWQYRTSSSGSWVDVASTVAGYNAATLQVYALQSMNGYQYRCVVTDSSDRVATSNAATLTYTVAFAITSQPQNQSISESGWVYFSVSATGVGLTYAWQYKKPSDNEWQYLTESYTQYNTDTMREYAVAANNGYQYRCIVTNSDGESIISSVATLTYSVVLSITSQPTDVSASGSNAVTFSIAASGSGLTYIWQYRTSSSGTWTNTTSSWSGYNTRTLAFIASSERNGWQFRCVVTDSNNATVNSNAATFTYIEVLAITQQPQNQTADKVGYVYFTVVATGTDLSYRWQYRASSAGTWTNAVTFVGYSASTLAPIATEDRNGWQFRCVVTDISGNSVTSNAATLTFVQQQSAIIITQQPQDVHFTAVGYVNFSVVATGNGLTYAWQRKKGDAAEWEYITEASLNYTSATMRDVAVAGRNGWQYRCVITDADGNTVNSNVATMIYDGASITITQQPQDQTANSVDFVYFTVVAAGENLTYQWQYRTSSTGNWTKLDNYGDGYDTATLMQIAQPANNGWQYRCSISNSGGYVVTSDYATLTYTGQ